MVKAKKYVLTKHFVDEPKPDDLTLVEFELPALKNGDILVQVEYFSVDPYMRPFSAQYPTGSTMIGSQIAKIIESKNPKYPVGERIVGFIGWTTHHVLNPDDPEIAKLITKPRVLPDLTGLPISLGLGVLGMPGLGSTEVLQPGETLVVSGAAGAVGSHVGQIGKILAMKVIGITGSDYKCKWLVDELKFDHAINYKTEDIKAALKKAAPDGADCYFDNVGGEISSAVIYTLKEYGRVSVCRSISSYNADPAALPKATLLQPALLFNQLTIQGFEIMRWDDRWMEGIKENTKWVREGKLRYRETVTVGFENIFEAFMGVLKGENVGKAIAKL